MSLYLFFFIIIILSIFMVAITASAYPALLGMCRHYQAFDENGVMYKEWYLYGEYVVKECNPNA